MSPLVYRSSAFRRVVEACLDAGGSSQPLLITGECGTGKTRLARFTHDMGRCREKPLVQWCAAGSELMDPLPELLGVVKGAFPNVDRDYPGLIVEAYGGTLVVNHLNLLSRPGQEALLRFLEDGAVRPVGSARAGRVDARLISTSSEDPRELAERGQFLPQLAERLLAQRITVPPLRERRDDIMPLLTYFIKRQCEERGRRPPAIPPDVVRFLERLDWPGNAFDVRSMVNNLLVRARVRAVSMDCVRQLARDLHL